MVDGTNPRSGDEQPVSRRSMLRSLGAGAVALAGLGTAAGTGAADDHDDEPDCWTEYRNPPGGPEIRECCDIGGGYGVQCEDWHAPS